MRWMNWWHIIRHLVRLNPVIFDELGYPVCYHISVGILVKLCKCYQSRLNHFIHSKWMHNLAQTKHFFFIPLVFDFEYNFMENRHVEAFLHCIVNMWSLWKRSHRLMYFQRMCFVQLPFSNHSFIIEIHFITHNQLLNKFIQYFISCSCSNDLKCDTNFTNKFYQS